MAEKVLPQEYYLRWNEEFKKASKALVMRDEMKARLAEQIEKDLILLGSTAIEDML